MIESLHYENKGYANRKYIKFLGVKSLLFHITITLENWDKRRPEIKKPSQKLNRFKIFETKIYFFLNKERNTASSPNCSSIRNS